MPFCLSLYETGGAKSAALKMPKSSCSLPGVGSEARGVGGGMGFRAAGRRPLMDDMLRGGAKRGEPKEL